MHDSAVASRSPRAATPVEHELLDRPLVLGEEVAAQPGAANASASSSARAWLPSANRSRWSRSRERRSWPPRRPRRRRPRPARGRRRTRSPEEAEDPPYARARPREDVTHRLRLERGRPEPPELPGRAGSTTTAERGFPTRTPERSRQARARSRRPAGSPACARLLRSRCTAGAGARKRAGDAFDLPLEPSSRTSSTPAARAHGLDGPVVVRRAEAARDEAQVGREALGQRGPQLVRPIADDDDPRGLEAETQRLLGKERPVPIGALAADELAPGDDDDCAGASASSAGSDGDALRGDDRPAPSRPGVGAPASR